MRRRMNALSSTTSTARFDGSRAVPPATASEDTVALLEGPDFHASVVEMEVHASPVIAADVFGDDADLVALERLPRGGDIAIADVDAATRQEVREHTRAADELGAHPRRVGAETGHLGEKKGDGRRGELRRIRPVARHRFVGEQRVGESTDTRYAVVERDRDARAETDRDEYLVIAADGALRHLDADLRRRLGVDHTRRKMRSRASTAANRDRTGPS